MTGRRLSPLFTWRSAIAESDLPPPARHLALTLSLYMSERGDSAWPSQDTLAHDTGMGRTTIKRHLARLEDDGWIRRTYPDGQGRGKSTRYTATIPTGSPEQIAEARYFLAAAGLDKGGQDGPLPSIKGARAVDKGGQSGPRSRQEGASKPLGAGEPAPGEGDEEPPERAPIRDPVWDGLVAETRTAPATRDEEADWGRSTKQIHVALSRDYLAGEPLRRRLDLRDQTEASMYAGVRTEVRRRAAAFRRRYPGATLTHRALRNRWGELGPAAGPEIPCAECGEPVDPATAVQATRGPIHAKHVEAAAAQDDIDPAPADEVRAILEEGRRRIAKGRGG